MPTPKLAIEELQAKDHWNLRRLAGALGDV